MITQSIASVPADWFQLLLVHLAWLQSLIVHLVVRPQFNACWVLGGCSRWRLVTWQRLQQLLNSVHGECWVAAAGDGWDLGGGFNFPVSVVACAPGRASVLLVHLAVDMVSNSMHGG